MTATPIVPILSQRLTVELRYQGATVVFRDVLRIHTQPGKPRMTLEHRDGTATLVPIADVTEITVEVQGAW